MPAPDVLVLGAGAVGLAVAEAVSRRGLSAVVVERGRAGRGASWAAAGYLSLRKPAKAGGAFFALCRASRERYAAWCAALAEESGMDPEFEVSGSLDLFRDEREREAAEALRCFGEAAGLAFEALDAEALSEREPALSDAFQGGFFHKDSAQVRPPRLLSALGEVLRRRGVRVLEESPVAALRREGDRIASVRAGREDFFPGAVVVAAGAWSGELARRVGLQLPVRPLRGQAVLYRARPGMLRHLIFAPEVYLVPRRDGRVFAGSTVEEAGFDASPTEEGIAKLRRCAEHAVPALASAQVEGVWAGLRPGTPDGRPILGRVEGFSNLWWAAGHFGYGILLAPATGELLASALAGEEPFFDPAPFAWPREVLPPVEI